jgi:hypothetical protein
MVFHPKGFLVAILPGPDEAERAAAALRAAGFANRELRTITPRQIVDDYARYTAQMSMPRCVVTAFTDGQETLDLHPVTPVTAATPCGCTSSTTTRPTAPSAGWPAAPRCTSGTTHTANEATSTSAVPPHDVGAGEAGRVHSPLTTGLAVTSPPGSPPSGECSVCRGTVPCRAGSRWRRSVGDASRS